MGGGGGGGGKGYVGPPHKLFGGLPPPLSLPTPMFPVLLTFVSMRHLRLSVVAVVDFGAVRGGLRA